jgi:hypothetical protein
VGECVVQPKPRIEDGSILKDPSTSVANACLPNILIPRNRVLLDNLTVAELVFPLLIGPCLSVPCLRPDSCPCAESRTSKLPFSFRFSNQNVVYICVVYLASSVPCCFRKMSHMRSSETLSREVTCVVFECKELRSMC